MKNFAKLITILLMSSFTAISLMEHIQFLSKLGTPNYLAVYLGLTVVLTSTVYSWTVPAESENKPNKNTFKF